MVHDVVVYVNIGRLLDLHTLSNEERPRVADTVLLLRRPLALIDSGAGSLIVLTTSASSSTVCTTAVESFAVFRGLSTGNVEGGASNFEVLDRDIGAVLDLDTGPAIHVELGSVCGVSRHKLKVI